MPETSSGLRVTMSSDKEADVYLYDMIGYWGISADAFRKEWKAIPKATKQINLHINSNGGSAFDGNAMYNLIAQTKTPVTAFVDGLAASAASIVAMGAKKIVMAKNAMMMVHNPQMLTIGDHRTHQKSLDTLNAMRPAFASPYVAKTAKTLDEVLTIMDDETWYTAQAAVDAGFADEVGAEVAVAAQFEHYEGMYAQIPEEAKAFFKATAPGASVSRPERKPETPPVMVATGKEPLTMADDEKKVSAATIAEIEAACPEADPAFVLAQVKAGATVAQAQAAYIAKQSADLKAEREARAAAETKAAQASAEKPGVPPVGAGRGGVAAAEGGEDPIAQWDAAIAAAEGGEDPIAQWDAAIATELHKPGMTQKKAISACVKKHPDLHRAMLEAHNAKFGRPCNV